MPELTDQSYLLNEQYRDASNLNARIRLHQLYSVRPRGVYELIFDTILEHEGSGSKRILEVGCGPGQLWIDSFDRVPRNWDITLSDFSPGMLEEAARNLASVERPFTFAQVDAQAIPYGDAKFDAVIANYMLYHIPDKRKAIGETARILRPGGRLYAATSGLENMRELEDLLRDFDPNAEPVAGRLVHEFVLENGAEQLAEFYSQVETYKFEEGLADGLIVTEAGPLVDHVLSTCYGRGLPVSEARRFADYVDELIRRDGPIRISKVTGMFVATKAVA